MWHLGRVVWGAGQVAEEDGIAPDAVASEKSRQRGVKG